MDPSDFSFDALFSSQTVDELVIPQQSPIMATTQQPQEIENQFRTNRTRNNEPDVSVGFDQNLTNQTIFQSASSNNNAVGWNWVDNTHSVNTSHSQEESQGFVLQSTRNDNMFQEIPEVRRTMEATSSIQLPLDLSEIFVFPIESANQPSEPPPYPASHQSHNIVPEQLSNLSTSNTTVPQAVHSTAFVNPGENSERSTSQNNSNFPYLMSNNGYSSYSTPQQNSEGGPIMNYNNRNNLTPTGSAFHRFQYELYRSRPSPRTHAQSSEQQNRITGSVSHSSRLTSSHEGYAQSRIHPYYTTGQQQQRDSVDIRGRRFGHNQNSATFSSSSDSANYYQRNTNQQTAVDYSTIQSNLTTATNLPTTYELDRPNIIRTVNNSQSVSTSDSQSTSVGSRTSQAARESSFFTSSNNSLGGASVFLPFNQPKQEPKRNNRWANGMIKPLNRNTKISTAVQLSAARQFITQAASSAAAAGYSEFSRSLTEILQDLEKLTNSFSPEFLISGQAEIKAFRSPIPRIPTCSVCLDKLISTILFPCRHFICENCAPKIDKCGLCRNIIQSRHQVYF